MQMDREEEIMETMDTQFEPLYLDQEMWETIDSTTYHELYPDPFEVSKPYVVIFKQL